MLMEGKVLDPSERNTMGVRTILQLNHKLAYDSRIQGVMIPVADGLYLCRKVALY